MPILETDRLSLRVFAPADVDAFAAICGDPEVMRYYREPWTREIAERFIRSHIRRQDRRGYSLWAAIDREDARLIGFCGLVEQSVEGVEEIEVGYMLDQRYWGRGLATEAALGVHEYAHGALGLTRLISLIDPRNLPSIRVARKTGMGYEREVEYDGKLCHVYRCVHGRAL